MKWCTRLETTFSKVVCVIRMKARIQGFPAERFPEPYIVFNNLAFSHSASWCHLSITLFLCYPIICRMHYEKKVGQQRLCNALDKVLQNGSLWVMAFIWMLL